MSAPVIRPAHSDAAVIDVGSNSVRLVLYRIEGRAIWTVYNEKVLAGLGRDLATTGRLSIQGAATALIALKRFRALIDASHPTQVFVAATAAVRQAADGAEFCLRVEREAGLRPRVLTGEEEAYYAALGVLEGAPDSLGLVGDLGGASLELTRLVDGRPARGLTLPLGPFAMPEVTRTNMDMVRSNAAQVLKPLTSKFAADTLNAVGGAWRNFALLQMRLSDYPLEILHEYEIGRAEVLEAARFISQQSRGSLERIEGISRRRVEALPYAATILEVLVEQLNVRRVVFSAYGLREGLLLEAMDRAVQVRDPLLDGCAALGARREIAEALGDALDQWLGKAFASLPPVFGSRDRRLVAAAGRLADLGAQLHPDHRAHLVFEQVLRAPIPAMNHSERVFLACSAFFRHTGSAQVPAGGLVARLLSPDRLSRARALGTAIRLGCDLSGRSPELLSHTQLELTMNDLLLRAEGPWREILLGEQTAKRARTLAGILGRRARLESY